MRRSRSATTAQPAGSGTVPGQRDAQEGTRYPEAQAEYGQTQGRHAGAPAYGEPAESRPEAARRHYYGMAGTLMVLTGMLTFFIGITGVIGGSSSTQSRPTRSTTASAAGALRCS